MLQGVDGDRRSQGVVDGAIAQLGERLHGMQEVSGSIPLSSTKLSSKVQRARVWAFCFFGEPLGSRPCVDAD